MPGQNKTEVENDLSRYYAGDHTDEPDKVAEEERCIAHQKSHSCKGYESTLSLGNNGRSSSIMAEGIPRFDGESVLQEPLHGRNQAKGAVTVVSVRSSKGLQKKKVGKKVSKINTGARKSSISISIGSKLVGRKSKLQQVK